MKNLDTIDLSPRGQTMYRPHSYTAGPVRPDTLFGITTFLRPEDQARSRADRAEAEALVKRATKDALCAFIERIGGFAPGGDARRRTTRDDLALQARLHIMRKWWPLTLAAPAVKAGEQKAEAA